MSYNSISSQLKPIFFNATFTVKMEGTKKCVSIEAGWLGLTNDFSHAQRFVDKRTTTLITGTCQITT